jgi:hypothetical protein
VGTAITSTFPADQLPMPVRRSVAAFRQGPTIATEVSRCRAQAGTSSNGSMAVAVTSRAQPNQRLKLSPPGPGRIPVVPLVYIMLVSGYRFAGQLRRRSLSAIR